MQQPIHRAIRRTCVWVLLGLFPSISLADYYSNGVVQLTGNRRGVVTGLKFETPQQLTTLAKHCWGADVVSTTYWSVLHIVTSPVLVCNVPVWPTDNHPAATPAPAAPIVNLTVKRTDARNAEMNAAIKSSDASKVFMLLKSGDFDPTYLVYYEWDMSGAITGTRYVHWISVLFPTMAPQTARIAGIVKAFLDFGMDVNAPLEKPNPTGVTALGLMAWRGGFGELPRALLDDRLTALGLFLKAGMQVESGPRLFSLLVGVCTNKAISTENRRSFSVRAFDLVASTQTIDQMSGIISTPLANKPADGVERDFATLLYKNMQQGIRTDCAALADRVVAYAAINKIQLSSEPRFARAVSSGKHAIPAVGSRVGGGPVLAKKPEPVSAACLVGPIRTSWRFFNNPPPKPYTKPPAGEFTHCQFGDTRLPHYCCMGDGKGATGPFRNPSVEDHAFYPGDSCPSSLGTVCYVDPEVNMATSKVP